jgi:hypothetical protein
MRCTSRHMFDSWAFEPTAFVSAQGPPCSARDRSSSLGVFAISSPSGAFPGPFTPQGVDNFDSAATEGYFIGVDFGSFSLLQMRRVTSPGGTPTLSANIPITVAITRFPANVPHLGNTGGTNGLLDGLDDRLYAAQIRNGALWTAHSIGTNSAGNATPNPSTLRNSLRWYQFGNLTGAPTITQSGTVFDAVNGNGANANWYWIPSVAVNGQGHAAMGFSAAGITRADAAFTGRLATDALGTMPGPLTRITNTTFDYNPALTPGNSNPRRWGDFSFTSVDPIDDMSIWTVQEFTNAADSYGVRVAKLNAPPPATPNTPTPSSMAAGQASVSVTLTGHVDKRLRLLRAARCRRRRCRSITLPHRSPAASRSIALPISARPWSRSTCRRSGQPKAHRASPLPTRMVKRPPARTS